MVDMSACGKNADPLDSSENTGKSRSKTTEQRSSTGTAAKKATTAAKGSTPPEPTDAKTTGKKKNTIEGTEAKETEDNVDQVTRYDVVIIGGGPGGYAAALYGASKGLNIALVEEGKLGGTCLNVGCIPAKQLLEVASVYRTVLDSGEFGISTGEDKPACDWSVVMARKEKVISRLVSGLSTLLGHRKVTVYSGTGTLCGQGMVQVASSKEEDDSTSDGDSNTKTGNVVKTISAPSIILATGSKPRTIPGFEVDGKLVMTSDEVLSLAELPNTVAVIGGGAIGCEFASMMADVGVKVTLLEALPTLLSGCDTDVIKMVERSFRKRRIEVHTNVTVNGHEPHTADTASGKAKKSKAGFANTAKPPDIQGTKVHFGDGKSVDVDLVVVSVGRKPYTKGLELAAAGVKSDERGFVPVDERCRTSAEGVWAVGDVIDTPQLAHVAFAEGMLVIDDIRGKTPTPIDYHNVPWCIYSHPEVAFAGHSETSAVEAGYEVVTSSHRYMANGRAMIIGETDGVVKVIAEKQVDGTAGRILGVHMCGPWVTEQLGQGYLAVNWEATVTEVAALIQPHPTLSELFSETTLTLADRSLHG